MITVENLLDAYAIALDLWIDPELAILENGHPRENPTPEYATLIRKAVSAENAKLRELVARMAHVLRADDEWTDPFYCNPYCADQFRCRSDDCVEVECPIVKSMRELGVEV